MHWCVDNGRADFLLTQLLNISSSVSTARCINTFRVQIGTVVSPQSVSPLHCKVAIVGSIVCKSNNAACLALITFWWINESHQIFANPRIGLTSDYSGYISTRLVAARRRKSNYSLPLSPRLAHFSLPIFVTLPVSYRAHCRLHVSHCVVCCCIVFVTHWSKNQFYLWFWEWKCE